MKRMLTAAAAAILVCAVHAQNKVTLNNGTEMNIAGRSLGEAPDDNGSGKNLFYLNIHDQKITFTVVKYIGRPLSLFRIETDEFPIEYIREGNGILEPENSDYPYKGASKAYLWFKNKEKYTYKQVSVEDGKVSSEGQGGNGYYELHAANAGVLKKAIEDIKAGGFKGNSYTAAPAAPGAGNGTAPAARPAAAEKVKTSFNGKLTNNSKTTIDIVIHSAKGSSKTITSICSRCTKSFEMQVGGKITTKDGNLLVNITADMEAKPTILAR